MLAQLLPLLALKAKAVGLVAGTALVTSAVVGGGTVAVTTVSAQSPVEATSEQTVPGEDLLAEVTPEPTTPEPAAAEPTTAEPTAAPAEEVVPPAEEPVPPLVEEQEAAAPPHECLPGEWRNHGDYVSSYARSLPKGPGRGPLVSAAAQSDCGKTAGQVAEGDADDAEPGRPAKPGKPANAGVGKGAGKGAAGKGKGKGAGKD